MKWKVARATMTGKAHQMAGMKCQDFIRQEPKDDFVCVVAVDGAGSAKHSFKGAEFVSRKACDIFLERGVTLFELTDEEIKHIVLQNINNELQKMAQEYSCGIEDFACTLMFFISDGSKYIVGNLGDGLIGFRDASNVFNTLLDQERGKYVNVSYFVTSNGDYLRIKRGNFCTSHVYFIMTDGTVECLYNRKNKSFANALNVYCGLLDKYEHMQISRALMTNMYKLFPTRTDDDCALALIMGKER